MRSIYNVMYVRLVLIIPPYNCMQFDIELQCMHNIMVVQFSCMMTLCKYIIITDICPLI